MTWAKVDDTLYSHPKRRAAGFEALGLWVVAMSYCAAHLTDGRVTDDDCVELCRGNKKLSQKLGRALVEAGLWDRVTTPLGYQFHDWHHYQPTRASVLEQRARKAEAGRRGGQASAQARASTTQVNQELKHPANQIPPGRSRPVDPADRARAREVPDPNTGDPKPVADYAKNFADMAAELGAKQPQ